MEDAYFIPKGIKITTTPVREILKQAVIVRNIKDKEEKWHTQKLTFKFKEFDVAGNIINQSSVNCEVKDTDNAKLFLNAIGYVEMMCIVEDDIAYEKDGLGIAVKDILGGEKLIEIETNEKYTTIEKVKEKLQELALPVDTSNYFVKKAEVELEKKLNSLFN